MKSATIIYNPAARNAPSLGKLRLAVERAALPGWHLDLRISDGPGHASSLARQAAEDGAAAAFACGGDGTINEVVNGLAGSETALGVIRGGMGNVFAKELGVSRRPERALQQQLEGKRCRFDLGVAGDRYFLLMAGIGFDAAVVRRVPARWKRLLGSSSYALWGLSVLRRYRARPAQLRFDCEKEELALYWALLGNTRSYGGIVDIAGGAVVDDGLLDGYFFAGQGAGWLATSAVNIALKRPTRGKGASFRRLRRLEVITPGLAVQGDGEYFGETPMSFSVADQALHVLLPAGRGRRLLSRP